MPDPFDAARASIRHATLDPHAANADAEIRRAFGPRDIPQPEPEIEQEEPPRPPGRPTEQLQTADGRPTQPAPKPVSQLSSGVGGPRKPLTAEEAFRRFIEKAIG